MTYLDGNHNAGQVSMPESLIRECCRQGRRLAATWRRLEAYLLIRILQDDPFVAAAGEMVAYALYARPLHAQLHQLMGDLCSFALDLAPEAYDKGDDFTLNFFQGC